MERALGSPSSIAERQEQEHLLQRMRSGEEAAFEEFVRQHSGRALAQARRILENEADAADAVQEAFLSSFKSLPVFRGHANLGTWFYRIVTNAALMRLRNRRNRQERDIEDLLPRFYRDGHRVNPCPAWQLSPEEMIQSSELRRLVTEKISELPEKYRNVLILRDIEGMSAGEAARELGDSEGAVKTRLCRARQALRKLLEEELVL